MGEPHTETLRGRASATKFQAAVVDLDPWSESDRPTVLPLGSSVRRRRVDGVAVPAQIRILGDLESLETIVGHDRLDQRP